MALGDLGAEFEHYRVVEFDRFAIASYNAIHGTNFEPMDIRNVKGADLGITDTDKYCHLLTYSFPCQDLSNAGKQAGMTKGSGTRSGLLWEVERLLNECIEYNGNIPEILLLENVPAVHGKKNMPDFQKWIDFLESKGYSNYWQDLNAKDYGIAQNRNRTFMVSLLGEYNYHFPEPVPLEKTMKDYLEDEVDEKYYINSEKAQKLIQKLIDSGQLEGGNASQLITRSMSQKQGKLQTALSQDMTTESETEKRMVPVSLKNCGTELEKFSDVANTLMARDYKGFGNQGMNGVIECEKKF